MQTKGSPPHHLHCRIVLLLPCRRSTKVRCVVTYYHCHIINITHWWVSNFNTNDHSHHMASIMTTTLTATMSSILTTITTFLNPYCIAQFQIHSRYSSNYSLKHIDTVRFTECINYGKGRKFIQIKNTYKFNYLYQSSVMERNTCANTLASINCLFK